MTNSELKANIARIEAMNPIIGGLLEERLNEIKSKLDYPAQ